MDTPTPQPTTSIQPAAASLTRGVIIGLLVIVLTLLVSALYLWGSMLSKNIDIPTTFTPPSNNEPETPRADADVNILRTMSSSDEVTSIEADLESTNLETLDQELSLIENDLKE